MSDSGQPRSDETFAEVEGQIKALKAAGDRLAGGSFEAVGKKRAFKVTVNGSGELVGIKFLTRSYRTMPGEELADQLVEAIGEARRKAIDAGLANLVGIMPSGSPAEELLSGKTDMAEIFGDAMRWLGVGPVAEPAPGPRGEVRGG
ncbi:YbaB/EbfC family nucleoid-associated protein [Micromonospora sp. NPDC047548]|uniref:YbaB/EbfC family nucleoid-associated protein n=1 Tax=Micromonospora sp. NPDC047548 TaxID=3155624 RepID=UPI0033EAD171